MTTFSQQHVLSQQCTFQTPDGQRLSLRRVATRDRANLIHFLQQLSERTRWQRYMTGGFWTRDLLEREVDRLMRGNGDPNVCLVVTAQRTTHEEIIAVGELLRTETSSTWAEVALTVRDDFQHHGIGRKLTEELAAIASARGITTFRVHTIPTNAPVMQLVRRFGHIARWDMHHGELQMHVTPLSTGASSLPPARPNDLGQPL